MSLNYRMSPVVSVDELERAVERSTGHKFQNEFRQLLLDDNYMNDVYVNYYFEDDAVYHGYSWEKEDKIMELNLVNKFLREEFGDEFDSIIVDVSW